MKEIRMDWDTYQEEIQLARKYGFNNALREVAFFLDSQSKFYDYMKHRDSIGTDTRWKFLLKVLRREDEFIKQGEE